MSRKYFGTDGIRGTVNQGALTPDMALKIGLAAGRVFRRGDHVHRVVIGKDTRRSGYMLEPALASGFVAAGMDVIMVGPMPTPAVAMLVKSLRADLGVMISASHNPHYDNGIKFFGPDGFKLCDEQELEIESIIDGETNDVLVPAERLGSAQRLEDARGRYVEFAKATVPAGVRFEGLKVVVDCANGAAYKVAPTVLWELGAEVIAMGVRPDGFNINEKCGSTHPEEMCKRVVAEGADLGIALDGDADRLILCDENGEIIDGDQIMALITRNWHKRGILKGSGLVATVMSNLGLERLLESEGLMLARTKVGDRYVVEEMRKSGFNVGGEQSGHVVLSDFCTTGDGLVSALQVMTEIKQSGLKASKACKQFDRVPQLLKNVRYSGGDPLEADNVKASIADAEARLNGSGRLVIRKSGTEPLVRVMAEGDDAQLVEQVVDSICREVEAAV
ncbi:phosphoglucosamine mutase [Kordiimonas sp. SCSIO 12603]|uniref:phosphoglucosamine mutase n=1 Tax=Kordiimonas sp. SCSIO 12603 TaxID=2829596 RepID=UPI002106C8D5|nr:phosphoglucosamine mutase [Kordiimonas sp. SCSIO 12603]UTW57979.1 phosphoglucosamine mutase [Kordiimonas sp. SCSIO 12603]